MPLPGILASAIIALAALAVGRHAPVVGAPVIALVAGVAVRSAVGSGAWLGPGVDFTLKRVLRLAIVLYGTTLSLGQVIHVGAASLLVIAVTIVVALGLTRLLGHWLRAPTRLVDLIGVGTAICGATAIVTIGPIIESRKEETAFALSTIFLFNMLAVAIYPLLGHALALSQTAYGAWTGAAIHDTSSVLAASFVYGEWAGQVATVVKLTRTLALVPLALLYGLIQGYTPHREPPGDGSRGGRRLPLMRVFPWFVLWFVAASLLNTVGLVGPDASRWAALMGRFLVVMVMAAVGMGADLGQVRAIGLRPFYIGLGASGAIAVVSIVLIRTTME
jgi:uncharacterized integral membrane protein (TIGR00698 family)